MFNLKNRIIQLCVFYEKKKKQIKKEFRRNKSILSIFN